MRLLLAAMPWQAIYRPSLPVGLLHSLVARECPDIDVAEYHGSLRWVEMLGTELPFDALIDDYLTISETGIFQGLGEVIFSGSLYGDAERRRADVRRIATEYRFDVRTVMTMQAMADDFVTAAADEVLAAEPDLVGFTSTFMQNVPSLALARRLKQRRPDLRVIIGGANCEGPMGHALHRNHPYVDYVVRGEAEQAFPRLLGSIATGDPVDDIAGLCWWNKAGDEPISVANPVSTHGVPPASIPLPDYHQWQRELESSPLSEYLRPELVIEGSRGCWWGEKHHCTFCGLNGSLMAFRSKPAEQFWDEIRTLVERHQILDLLACDNIFDMQYFSTLLPLLREADWDLCVHFEIKSNLRPDQLAALADAGITLVQPGVESLNANALKLMDKGVDGTSNVQTLHAIEENHMTVFWNYLYGFPGERDEDYQIVLDQLPALVHLQPPSGAARIVMERYSPHFEQPELGFVRREPAAFYRQAYELPDSELFDLAYYFDSDPAGIGDDLGAALDKAVDRWIQDYPSSTLTVTETRTNLVIEDRRRGWAERRHVLSGWHAVAYRALGRPRTANGVRATLEEAGHVIAPDIVEGWLRECLRDGLVFTDDRRWIALATRTVPVKLGYALGGRPDRWEVPA
jgi:ribosomal peptide maturation radical SAM protein 1